MSLLSKMKWLMLFLFPITLSAQGGSNYAWYNLTGCNRDPYGVIKNYHKPAVRAEVDSQLQAMYDVGQRRLRIPIFHIHQDMPWSGTLMSSAGGNLSQRHQDNFRDLLAKIREIQFEEVIIGFFPTGINSPSKWFQPITDWNDLIPGATLTYEEVFQENWNLIVNLREIIVFASIPYYIDLLNEGIPNGTQQGMLQYVQRLWSYYGWVYGKYDTVGFSIASNPERLAFISAVYDGGWRHGWPYRMDLHLYGDALNFFAVTDAKLNEHGYFRPLIIGETFYNDSQSAQEIQAASRITGREVLFVLQWPLTRAFGCQDVDVASPLDFSAYIKEAL